MRTIIITINNNNKVVKATVMVIRLQLVWRWRLQVIVSLLLAHMMRTKTPKTIGYPNTLSKTAGMNKDGYVHVIVTPELPPQYKVFQKGCSFSQRNNFANVTRLYCMQKNIAS
jgi:hypothetical protein